MLLISGIKSAAIEFSEVANRERLTTSSKLDLATICSPDLKNSNYPALPKVNGFENRSVDCNPIFSLKTVECNT